jgi:hypothetical protein
LEGGGAHVGAAAAGLAGSGRRSICFRKLALALKLAVGPPGEKATRKSAPADEAIKTDVGVVTNK